jgi:protease-4
MFFFGALSGCLVVVLALFLLAAIAMSSGDATDFTFAAEKVAIVPIEGEILDARDTLDLLHRYARNSTIKAVVVRINSPGGAIAPSQEIYSAIRRIRAEGKPVIASMDSVAASGGYYIASACDPIIANSGTITGSIGVILQWFDMKELVSWAKLKPETITSGALKDAGSPYRELTAAERQYFQGIVTQLHTQFVRDVAAGRASKLKLEEVARVADGRVFTGEQALGLKLVDRIGTIDDAVRAAGAAGGITGEPARIWPRRREGGLLELLASDGASALLEKVLNRRVPQFLYRWM